MQISNQFHLELSYAPQGVELAMDIHYLNQSNEESLTQHYNCVTIRNQDIMYSKNAYFDIIR